MSFALQTTAVKTFKQIIKLLCKLCSFYCLSWQSFQSDHGRDLCSDAVAKDLGYQTYSEVTEGQHCDNLERQFRGHVDRRFAVLRKTLNNMTPKNRSVFNYTPIELDIVPNA
ncbi:hypothetical protein PoB_004384500 [Plakobranchus ocellatus]|uniref:Uncharacterized protein n=1 Tax=Plakobranchus ocellatus TaxID=259542 RepID=A0AAV4BE12_9GAST|nr:hypothetical protein PoB_004384500 [Plakobranchus ocellatus]